MFDAVALLVLESWENDLDKSVYTEHAKKEYFYDSKKVVCFSIWHMPHMPLKNLLELHHGKIKGSRQWAPISI